MEFRISDTFTDSLNKLTGQEQKAVKTTAFDLQLNPANPGMKFHRIDKSKDPNFWSVRVNGDIRLIVHKTASSLTLCYVDHHDKAYQWAERRRLDTHPKTGAAQLVEVRETIQEIFIPKYVEKEESRQLPILFEHIPDSELLSYGVPIDWIDDVKEATEDTLFEIAEHLPQEAAEALLDLATGKTPKLPEVAPVTADPFEHPDAQRRFRVMKDVDELARALEYPWEKWTLFLHPDQRSLVDKEYNGPVRVAGSAGTGKTVVALHRAGFLARQNPDARILMTTFSDALANSLKIKLKRLISNEPRLAERLEVHSINTIGEKLYAPQFGKPRIASREQIKNYLKDAALQIGDYKFSIPFLMTEWEQIVDAWQLKTWDEYKDVLRLGRKTRLPENQRMILWSIFEIVRKKMETDTLITLSEMFEMITSHLHAKGHMPFDYIVVDEAQDMNVAQLKFLAALGGEDKSNLFLAGDLGQRIFQSPFSWKALGVDVRGRSYTLKINYRTSHQIRTMADLLLDAKIADVDGIEVERKGTISVFNGPYPDVITANSVEEEIEKVSQWIKERQKEEIQPHEMAVFVRSEHELERAKSAVNKAEQQYVVLDEKVETARGHISISTMHLAKGLEFRAIAVMACDDEVIPLQERVETVADEADLEEVYNTERHLLYVACTRARDCLLVSGVDPVSEFLEDMCNNKSR